LYWEINGSYLLAGRPFPQRRAWRGLLLRQQFLSSCCRLTTLKKDNVKDNDRERRRRRWESKRELGSTYSPVLQRGKLLTYQTKHYPSSNPGVSRPRICSKRCTAGQNDLQAAETDNRLVRLRRWDVKSVDLRVKSHGRAGKSSGLKYSSLHCPLQSPPRSHIRSRPAARDIMRLPYDTKGTKGREKEEEAPPTRLQVFNYSIFYDN
jgi:hypothetical protein